MENFMSCPLFYTLFFVFLSYILIGLFDFRGRMVLNIYRAIHAFIGSYFLFYFGWVSLTREEIHVVSPSSEKNDKYSLFFSLILPFTLIMTIYGVLISFTHTNPVLDAVGLKDRFLKEGITNFRNFRVTAMCVSSSVYGLVCATLTLCSFFLIKRRTKIQTTAIFLLLVNLLLTATRAAIIPFIIGLCIFIILTKGVSGIVKKVLIVVTVSLFLFPLLPEFIAAFMTQLFDSIIDVISPTGSGGKKYGGSNIDARGIQIAAAMELLKEKPLFGHGFAYASEALLKGKSHAQLLGMESYLCFLGIERGIVNMVAELFFYISCLIFYYKNRIYCQLYADLGIALITMFIPFLIFAWVGGCWFFFMPILGYITKVIYLRKQKLLYLNY
ncbi:MAG: O-antigen ligase family protein [Bacteroides sp.]|uniref:O-antigen ligase family protein n=1 Tax=Bacteroides sp. TaxID=29523 RepID=UPI002FC652A7